MFKHTITFAAVVGLVFALAPAAQASGWTGPGGIISPVGLAPGGKYHLVFVTSGKPSDASTSASLATYHAAVNTVADGSSLTDMEEVTWYCIGSTATANAIDLFSDASPIYLLDGTTQVSATYELMWSGSIDNKINISENGPDSGTIGGDAWTGTGKLGLASAYPLGSAEECTYGGAWSAGEQWISAGTGTAWDFKHLYAMSGELTVVPEPATMALLGLGALGLVFGRNRR
ncbi:MAG TPA: PEP-CTERM sorting domain-containing protein [Phycisphaerae bacterium]|nr:PEP-CTERM sorting domain-containing protein [Phycisphaerae bacterium]